MPRTQTIKDLVIQNLKIEKDLIVDGTVYAAIENTNLKLASNGVVAGDDGLTEFNFNNTRRSQLEELHTKITDYGSGEIIKGDERLKLRSIFNQLLGYLIYVSRDPVASILQLS